MACRRSRAMPPSRTDRLLARVDRHLPTLADAAARRAFLDAMSEGFARAYASFIVGEGERAGDDPPQAADYMLTIVALAARRRALGGGGDAVEASGSNGAIA